MSDARPPQRVAIGLGCRKGCESGAIVALVGRALDQAGAPVGQRRLFTIADKRDEPGLAQAARDLGLSLDYCTRDALDAQAGQVLTPSAAAGRRFGVASVSEAAALAGAGPGGRLTGPRIAADGVTCAIAIGKEPWA